MWHKCTNWRICKNTNKQKPGLNVDLWVKVESIFVNLVHLLFAGVSGSLSLYIHFWCYQCRGSPGKIIIIVIIIITKSTMVIIIIARIIILLNQSSSMTLPTPSQTFQAWHSYESLREAEQSGREIFSIFLRIWLIIHVPRGRQSVQNRIPTGVECLRI